MKRLPIIKVIIGVALGVAFGNWVVEAIQSPNCYYIVMAVFSFVGIFCNIFCDLKE